MHTFCTELNGGRSHHAGIISRIAFLLAVSLLAQTCKQNPISYETNPEEHSWDATLLTYSNSFQLNMYSIWASSARDVYVSGFNTLDKPIFHFDGKVWHPVTLPLIDGNRFMGITGFGANDVWAAGSLLYFNSTEGRDYDSALVMHFDGLQWRSMLPSHMGAQGLQSVWGTSSTNLYVGSKDGKVIHYNGVAWSIDTLYLGLAIVSLCGDESRLLAIGNTWKGTPDDSLLCYLRTLGRWTLVDVQNRAQLNVAPHFGLRLFSPGAGLFYSGAGGSILKWLDGKWIEVAKVPLFVDQIRGTGEINMLAVGWKDGPAIQHWDGQRWGEISQPRTLLPNTVELFDAWTDGREAFVVGNNGAVTYVLHGKK